MVVQDSVEDVVSRYFEKSQGVPGEGLETTATTTREEQRLAYEERAANLFKSADLASRAIPFIRELLETRQRRLASAFAQNLLAMPDMEVLGHLGMALVALGTEYSDFAWHLFNKAGRDQAMQLMPGELFGLWLEKEPEVAEARLTALLDAEPEALGQADLWLIAQRAGALKNYELLAVLIERIAAIDPAFRGLTDEERIDLEWARDYLASHPKRDRPATPVSEPGTINLGIIDYKMIDRHHATTNIGDYVQTLAFLSNLARFQSVRYDDSELGRKLEELKTRIAPEKRLMKRTAKIRPIPVNRDFSSWDSIPETTWMFAYGWYMHPVFETMFDFPFHESIRPIFISFHVNNREMLSDKAIDYLRKYQPIGCRDWTTVYLLREKGVQAFFSGCVTTTIGQIFTDDVPHAGDDTIALVDYSVKDDEFSGLNAVPYTQAEDGVREMKLVDALDAATKLLNGYRRYQKIATSRLHCYLPCTSIGLDVEFKPKNKGDVRFEGLMRLGKPRFERMRSNIAEKIELILRLIFNGADEERVYEKWRSICAPDLAAADAYCADFPAWPEPSFDIDAVVASLQADAYTLNSVAEGSNPVIAAFALDANLCDMLPVTVESAIRNLSRPAIFHVMARGIARSYFEDLAADFPQAQFTIYDFDKVNYTDDLNLLKHTTASTIDRLLLPDLLAAADKIIYLDVDIVIQGDLAKLYDMELGDLPLAGKSSIPLSWRTGHDLLQRATYRMKSAKAWQLRRHLHADGRLDFRAFNAGVTLMNLARMREDKSSRLTVPLVENFSMNDQDALNMYARSNRAEFDPIWNAVPAQEPTGNDGILHFAGTAKPWGPGHILRAEEYLHYKSLHEARRAARKAGAA
jgi:lipopolysaccharide biosynthesis glycosyltransferase